MIKFLKSFIFKKIEQKIPEIETRKMIFPLEWIPFDMGDGKPLVKKYEVKKLKDKVTISCNGKILGTLNDIRGAKKNEESNKKES